MMFRRPVGWCVAQAYALAGARRRARARCRAAGTVLPIVFHDSPPREVEGVLAALKGWGFRFVSSDDVLSGRAAEGTCAWISFDDGWRETAEAVPVLERFEAPASVFIAPGETARGWVWTDNLWNMLPDPEWHQWYALPAEERYARVDAAWTGARPQGFKVGEVSVTNASSSTGEARFTAISPIAMSILEQIGLMSRHVSVAADPFAPYPLGVF